MDEYISNKTAKNSGQVGNNLKMTSIVLDDPNVHADAADIDTGIEVAHTDIQGELVMPGQSNAQKALEVERGKWEAKANSRCRNRESTFARETLIPSSNILPSNECEPEDDKDLLKMRELQDASNPSGTPTKKRKVEQSETQNSVVPDFEQLLSPEEAAPCIINNGMKDNPIHEALKLRNFYNKLLQDSFNQKIKFYCKEEDLLKELNHLKQKMQKKDLENYLFFGVLKEGLDSLNSTEIRYIGGGTFGQVFRLLHEDPHAKRRYSALKKIKREKFNWSEAIAMVELGQDQEYKEFYPEFLGLLCFEESVYLHLEYTGITLEKFVKDNSLLKTEAVWTLFNPILRGIQGFQKHGYVHRDLKWTNVTVTKDDQNCRVVTIDFGSIVKCREQIPGLTGMTRLLIPPELLHNPFHLHPNSDLWPAGFILYFLCTGKNLWNIVFKRHGETVDQKKVILWLTQHSTETVNKLRFVAKQGLDPRWSNLFDILLSENADKRSGIFRLFNEVGNQIHFGNQAMASAAMTRGQGQFGNKSMTSSAVIRVQDQFGNQAIASSTRIKGQGQFGNQAMASPVRIKGQGQFVNKAMAASSMMKGQGQFSNKAMASPVRIKCQGQFSNQAMASPQHIVTFYKKPISKPSPPVTRVDKREVPQANDGTIKPLEKDGTTKPLDIDGTIKPLDIDGTIKPTDGTIKPLEADGTIKPLDARSTLAVGRTITQKQVLPPQESRWIRDNLGATSQLSGQQDKKAGRSVQSSGYYTGVPTQRNLPHTRENQPK